MMKKLMTILLAAAMLMSLLSGCRLGKKAPEATEIPTTTQAEVETTLETTEAATEAATEFVANDTVFKAGTWMAQYGYSSWYYFFDEGGASGSFADLQDGSGTGFTYVQTGDQGVLYLSDSAEGIAAKVTVQDENHITLVWDDQSEETFTYVSAMGADQFHFYSHNELAQLALDDYRAKNDPSDTSLEAAAMDNGDGTTTIQIYQNLGDHNSTAAYYSVDRFTGEGQSSDGTDVDLTNGTMDVDVFYGDSETKLPSDTIFLTLDELVYAEPVVMQMLSTVTQFQVVTLEYVENGDSYGFQVAEILYEAVAMSRDNAVVLFAEVPENIPDVGLIYKDRNGEKHLYALMYSGLDGSVLLCEETLL